MNKFGQLSSDIVLNRAQELSKSRRGIVEVKKSFGLSFAIVEDGKFIPARNTLAAYKKGKLIFWNYKLL